MSRSRTMLCAVYALLAVAALVATWSQNLAFFAATPDAGVMDFVRAGYANAAAASLSNDLYLLSLAVIVWMVVEAQRVRIRFVWVYVVLSFVVAISVSVPLFLIARERQLARTGA